MRSIQRRFKIKSHENPYSSSFVNFKLAIEGQNFKKRTIRHWFVKLVENDDYDKKEKRAILRELEKPKPP
ncbi:MAG: hypothetical protein US25_C0017G0009 [Candidatus Moranbacteria bacterium GW2011_GWE1_36_7]|nr:MAG: hypothetical protein UR99_C0025G0009 [Candidatus Moranbacteria bacterium GW2011_GWD2_36_12]KKQ06059.1 MAG: hypothetical protein US16_C0026G0009 [Candidatus Moranbacteria bacterium GW2011_GWE2_36_40]KKQ14911.1 MAG: hypothetical protein US25_C0017G0009 [Candidatus Moranbacteria bacterium GW2011_GWE1_36_7]